jgi:transcriptional regulator with XRE-family HTH domain
MPHRNGMVPDFSDIQKILADQVKARRKAMGLSQEKLAFDAEIDRTYVSQIERGLINPSLKVLWRLSVVLQVDLHSLLMPMQRR